METAPEKPKSSTIGSPEDDLTLRASMYGVLFQSYADKVHKALRWYMATLNGMTNTLGSHTSMSLTKQVMLL